MANENTGDKWTVQLLLSHLRDGEHRLALRGGLHHLLSHLRDGELEQKAKLPQKINNLKPNHRLNLRISSDNLTV